MNHFYDLPDDIIEKIIFQSHQILFSDCLFSICKHTENRQYLRLFKSIFYDSPMTNKEAQSYHLFCNWLDNFPKFHILYEDLQKNSYYRTFANLYD